MSDRPIHLLSALLLGITTLLSTLGISPVAQAAEPSATPSDEAAHPTDGRLFDPGVDRTEPAESAPEALRRMRGFVGAWDLEVETVRVQPEAGATTHTARGVALVTYMNRGHSLMERTRVADFADGRPRATLSFLAVSPQHGAWTFGEADSHLETIRPASGGFEKGSLVLVDASRPRGGPAVRLVRRTYRSIGRGQSADAWTVTLEASDDLGASWSPTETRRYRRRADADLAAFFPVRDDDGRPAADRPDEAAAFDFLLGRFDATHWRLLPDGSETRWTSHATGVHALDGHAILEFDSFDADPNLPDAATSIIRLYNRSERRWESLFLTNRSSSNLYFGGVQEGDEIVLHFFDADTTGPISHWIFYDIERDTYRWKGLLSVDRGETFRPTWTIDFRRVGEGPSSSHQ